MPRFVSGTRRSSYRQDHAVESAPKKRGTRAALVRGSDRREPCLNAEQLAYLARTGVAIEEQFGSPQDIEWAIEGKSKTPIRFRENIYFLQSCPITVLRPHSGSVG